MTIFECVSRSNHGDTFNESNQTSVRPINILNEVCVCVCASFVSQRLMLTICYLVFA